MKARTKSEELERICAYCEHATVLMDADACICQKNGVVRASGCCRRFRPDLLKVHPHLPHLPDGPEELPLDFTSKP